MCGICGIVGRVPGRAQRVVKMVSSLRHRGPDDQGVFDDGKLTMGNTRLAIIDMSIRGHQPMTNKNKTVWITFNGEIYNFASERVILKKKGVKFYSNSDTEVLLEMYEEYGDEFLNRLDGMFALAIYDKRDGPGNEKCLLARDPIGIKPLLYYQSNAGLVFASEIKALLASGLVSKQINPEGLRLLLTFGSVNQPESIIKGVKMLLPGHKLVVHRDKVTVRRFVGLDNLALRDGRLENYADCVAQLKSELKKTLQLQMVSDVPLGAFLSGGIDSSLLVAIMSQLSRKRIKTFSVGFENEGQDIDESNDAGKLAKYFSTDHTKVVTKGSDVKKELRSIIRALDQPSVDGVNSYFISKAASQSVKVVISGTGGDELFAGYPWFINMLKANTTSRTVRWYLTELSRSTMFDFLAKTRAGEFLETVRGSDGLLPQFVRQYQIFGSLGAAKMLSREICQNCSWGKEPSLDLGQHEDFSRRSLLQQISALCLRNYTQNQLLRDIDATSMSHSLEVRVPYLDTRIVSLALSLPDSSKLKSKGVLAKFKNGNLTYEESGAKRILFDVGRKLLPPGLNQQVKRGFGMPFGFWLKTILRDNLDDALSQTSVRRRGFFDWRQVKQTSSLFRENKIGWATPWLLMITELWAREFLD